MTKVEFDSSERVSCIYQTAQTWMKSGICTDVTVTCLDEKDKKVDFKCHKLMIFPILTQYCPMTSVECEDIEQVILTDVAPDFFKQFLNYVYGLENSNQDFSAFFSQNEVAEPLESNIIVKMEHEDDDEDIDDQLKDGHQNAESRGVLGWKFEGVSSKALKNDSSDFDTIQVKIFKFVDQKLFFILYICQDQGTSFFTKLSLSDTKEHCKNCEDLLPLDNARRLAWVIKTFRT